MPAPQDKSRAPTPGQRTHWPAMRKAVVARWIVAMLLAAFVDALTRDIPPRPADMDAMVRANLGLTA
jgi:hypothetical protein